MRVDLLLRLHDAAAPAWQIRPPGGPAPWRAVQPAQLHAELGRGALGVLVPGEEVLLTRVRLAPMGARRARQALPFALEEELADEVERLHFTPGETGAQPQPVAVAASERVARWQELLAHAGVRARLITPDVLALPWADGSWSVLLAGDRAWVRLGRQCGFATERDALPAYLAGALADAAHPPPQRAVLYAAAHDDAAHEVAAMLHAHGIALTQHRDRDQALDWLGSGLDAESAIDLLTGTAGGAVQAVAPRRGWLRSAALVAAISIVHLGVVAVQHRQAQSRVEALDARIAALYRAIRPGEPVPARPQARIAQELAARAHDDAAREERLLAVLTPAARRLGEATGWELQRLEFRDGRLDVDLRTPDAAALDRVQRELMRGGALSVERVSASATQGAAEARLRLRAADEGAR